MGQQHRRTVKRRRREAYLERLKAKAKAAAPAARRVAAPKAKAKTNTELRRLFIVIKKLTERLGEVQL